MDLEGNVRDLVSYYPDIFLGELKKNKKFWEEREVKNIVEEKIK
jgi:hypothetical protein